MFAALAALAFVLVAVLHDHWLAWALPDTVGVILDHPLVEYRLARQDFQGSDGSEKKRSAVCSALFLSFHAQSNDLRIR